MLTRTKKAFPFGGRLYIICIFYYTIALLPPLLLAGGNNYRCRNKMQMLHIFKNILNIAVLV